METMDQNSTKRRDCYAVHHGDYVGKMFIVCEVNDKAVGCLSVPDMKNVKVPTENWTIGRNSDIIERVEKTPKDVFKVCSAQYNKNENANN